MTAGGGPAIIVPMPVPPEPTDWVFPTADEADESGLLGIGADLEPGTLLAAYRSGIFPMPIDGHAALGWWSPDPRGILPLDQLVVSRSLRRSMTRFAITVDTTFEEVVAACADPSRDGGWIDDDIRAAYTRLHRTGWTHSIEVRDRDTTELVGGLYGVCINGLFAGESMFHHRADASKVALVALVEILNSIGVRLLDVQWLTPHLESLGAVAIPRHDYLALLADALSLTTQPFPGEVRP